MPSPDVVLPIDPENPCPEHLERAADLLRAGGILAYPTETLYGLGVDPFQEAALEKLFRLKRRSADMPVSILVKDRLMLREVAFETGGPAEELLNRLLPGPLTVIVEARPHIPPRLISGTGKVGVRISSHPLATHLFARFPAPITTTSANPSGHPGATTAGQISDYFSEGIDLILDAGPTPGGTGSTVVDLTGPRPALLREGAIPWDRILQVMETEDHTGPERV